MQIGKKKWEGKEKLVFFGRLKKTRGIKDQSKISKELLSIKITALSVFLNQQHGKRRTKSMIVIES